MTVTQSKKQTTAGEITLYALTNVHGSKVVLSTLGAGIIEIHVADRHGSPADVVMGYESPESYVNDGHCAGKTAGRYANRIANGRFTLDGKDYRLPINNGPNHLHGGPEGLQNQIWNGRVEGDKVVFTFESPDGHAGYPGNLSLKTVYSLDESDRLTIEYHAETDEATVINLTNHTYFNLNGHDAGTVLNHCLRLKASRYLPTDDTLIPTGEMCSVKNTPMDFTDGMSLGSRMGEDFHALKVGKGYDSCWVVDGYDDRKIKEIARLSSGESGRVLTIYSDQPGVQLYTGNWISDTPAGKGGHRYNDYDCVAIECQEMPDAPNQAAFPSAVLRPGEIYNRTIIFEFSIE